jgi:hypothetical protein
MSKLHPERSMPCRHTFDSGMAKRLRKLIEQLASEHPEVLAEHGISSDPVEYALLYNSAIQAARGSMAASTGAKQSFIETILKIMQSKGFIKIWRQAHNYGQNDYEVTLNDNRCAVIEAKGCPDGNNTRLWQRPPSADEFIIWFQCPDSLQNQPGDQLWSGVSTRLFPSMYRTSDIVDAVVFFDGRCGSAHRRCPKAYGLEGEKLRPLLTSICGQDNREWLPPPCVYLLPRKSFRTLADKKPAIHDLDSCKFARSLLSTFGVPEDRLIEFAGWAGVEVQLTPGAGPQMRVGIGKECTNGLPSVQGDWKPIQAED